MNEPSKEAMEKALFIANSLPPETINSLLVGGYETRDTLINILALEFTNYQKRIEKLEKDLKEAHMLLTGCQGTVLFKSVSFAKRVENFISKSHLAKGVKEG
jgi:hypothetical protein